MLSTFSIRQQRSAPYYPMRSCADLSSQQFSQVLLAKGLPITASDQDLIDAFSQFGILIDTLFIWDQQMAFLQFSNKAESVACYQHF